MSLCSYSPKRCPCSFFSSRTIQRAIMEVLFAPSIEASANAAKRRGIDPINVSPDGGAADPTRRLSCESDDSTHRVSDPAPDMDGMLGSALALHKRWQRKEGHTKAFNCILWCTIALGAMTSNISTRVVSRHLFLRRKSLFRCEGSAPDGSSYRISARVV